MVVNPQSARISDSRKMPAFLTSALLLSGCITCTQQVQQREMQAGEMHDVAESDAEDMKEDKELDLALEVPEIGETP